MKNNISGRSNKESVIVNHIYLILEDATVILVCLENSQKQSKTPWKLKMTTVAAR